MDRLACVGVCVGLQAAAMCLVASRRSQDHYPPIVAAFDTFGAAQAAYRHYAPRL